MRKFRTICLRPSYRELQDNPEQFSVADIFQLLKTAAEQDMDAEEYSDDEVELCLYHLCYKAVSLLKVNEEFIFEHALTAHWDFVEDSNGCKPWKIESLESNQFLQDAWRDYSNRNTQRNNHSPSTTSGEEWSDILLSRPIKYRLT